MESNGDRMVSHFPSWVSTTTSISLPWFVQDAAAEWAGRLASGPTRSFMMTKWLVNRSRDVDRRTLEDNEAWAVELNNGTMDMAEGSASFRERRDPVWRGF